MVYYGAMTPLVEDPKLRLASSRGNQQNRAFICCSRDLGLRVRGLPPAVQFSPTISHHYRQIARFHLKQQNLEFVALQFEVTMCGGVLPCKTVRRSV